MNTPSGENWLEQNQIYLHAAISAVKSRLLSYQNASSPKGGEAGEIDREDQELSRLESKMTSPPAINRIADLFGLSTFEKKMLLLCAGVELDAQLASLVQTLQGGSMKAPTFSLALSVFHDAHWSAVTPEAPLRYWKILVPAGYESTTQAPCSLDEQILHYLTGISFLPQKLKNTVALVEPDTSLVDQHRETMEALVRYCAKNNGAGIQIRGGDTSDKTTITASALSPYHFSVYLLNPALLPAQIEEVADWARLWSRSAALHSLALFIDGAQWEELDPVQKRHAIYLTDNVQGIVVLGMDHKVRGLNRNMQILDIKPLSTEEQYLVWQRHLGALAETLDGELDQITAQFNLNTGAIKRLSNVIGGDREISKNWDRATIRAQLWKACIEHTRPELETLAQRIEPYARWDDLVLPEMQKNLLKEISVHVRQRRKVYEEWGFAEKSKRGLGISALFSGESGTGKTMASEVIANELQLDLYRIDLSQVVNKYIGETEKNLKKIFDAAEGSGAILLFDEADALFGKRSEVKDSHDRYSNIEVSYLLQKMEEYRGLAILTTNMKNALDRAFLRRIRFVVQFPFPDMEMRADIWKRIFPKKTPLAGLDFQKLSALNIAGGNIRNIALNASFSAAGQNRPVTMGDIHLAARNEYNKLEKHMSSGESIL